MAGFFDDTESTTSPVVKSFFDDTEEINAPSQIDKDAPDFVPGMQRGLQNLQASTYGMGALIGEGLKGIGFEETGKKLKDFGIEGYQRNIEEAKPYAPKYSFKDVYTGEAGIGGAVDWAQGTLGELVPSMVEAAIGAAVGSMAGSATAPGAGTAAGAGVGAFAGRTILKKSIDEIVKKTVKEGTEKVVEDQIRKQVTKQALKKFGGKVGMGAAVFPMETGGMYAELLDSHGVDAPGTALLFGSLATAMEYAGGNSKLVDTFVDALAKGSTGIAKKSAKEILMNIPEEALQEGGQELMNVLNTVVNTDEKLLTGDNLERIIESMAAGAVGGGAGAGANYVMDGRKINKPSEFDNQVSKITSGGIENINKTLTEFDKQDSFAASILQNPEKLKEHADVLGISSERLADNLGRQTIVNQQLRDRLKVELAKPTEEVKPGVDPITDEVINAKINELRLGQEDRTQKINNFNSEADKLRKVFYKSTDATERENLKNQITRLLTSRNELVNETKQTEQKIKDFESPKKSDEIRAELQDFYDNVWSDKNKTVTPVAGVQPSYIDPSKDASESAEFINDNYPEVKTRLDQLLNQIDQEANAARKQQLQKIYDDVFSSYTPIKSAEESAKVFTDQLVPTSTSTFTNEQQVGLSEDQNKALDDLFSNNNNIETTGEVNNNAVIDNTEVATPTAVTIPPVETTFNIVSSIPVAPITNITTPTENVDVTLNQYAKTFKEAYVLGDIEIPEYMTVLDLIAKKDIESLTKIANAISQTKQSESDPIYAKDTSFKAKGKADLSRLIKMLGSQMYKGNLAEVTIKEVVQNSFDAVKASLNTKGAKGITDGRIDILVDPSNRIISIKDNGQGMSKDVLLNAFLTVAGTDKSGLASGDASGGFGMAKAAFLYGNEWIEINTVKNGHRYKFKANGNELLSKEINISDEAANKNEHGTVITIKVPENVEVNGEQKSVWFPYDVKQIDFFKQPLIHNAIEINLQTSYLTEDAINTLSDPNNNVWEKENFTPIQTGKNFDLSKYEKNTTIHFDWGDAELYIAKNRNPDNWSIRHNVLSAGVFQFTHDFNIAPYEKIPYDVILNVFPKVEADSANYPFNIRREGWKDTIVKDIKSLEAYVKNVALGFDAEQTVEQFKNIKSLPKININDIGTNNVDITDFLTKKPVVTSNETKAKAVVKMPKITVSGGQVKGNNESGEEVVLVDTNKKDDEKVNGSFKSEKEIPKAKDFLIDVGIDDLQPILHNNTNVDFIELASSNGYSAETLFAELGSLMLKVKEVLAEKTGWGYESLRDKDKSVFVGISIDKKYHGVNLVVPFQAILLNPLAVKSRTLPGLVHGYYDTIMHEFTHVPKRNHEESFILEKGNLDNLLASDGTDLEIRVALGRILKKHKAVLNLMRNEYEKSTTTNLAKALNDTKDSDAVASSRYSNESNGSIANGNAEWSGVVNSEGRQTGDGRVSTGITNGSGNVNFQISNQEGISKVNLEDIQKTFPGQKITKAEDGTISIQFKNGKGLTIKSIQQADQAFIKLAIETGQMSKNGKILGITIGSDILLNENFADNKTLWHENKHVLDNLGLITADDDAALNREFNKLRKAGKLEFALSTHKDPKQAMIENRANMFAQIMVNRDAYRNTYFGKIIQRIMDFFDKLLSVGKQTVSSLARDIESGKVYERKAGEAFTPEQIAKNVNSAIVYDGKMEGIPGVVEDLHNFTLTLPDGKQPSFSVPGEVTSEKVTEQLNKVLEKFSIEQSNISIDNNPMFNSKELKPLTQKMVNSLAFRDWFGNSKVKTIVYHGSPTFGQNDNFTFEQRDVTKTQSPLAGLGYFFAEDARESIGYAGAAGKINKTFLRIENPLTVSSWELPAFNNRAEAKAFQMQKKLQGYDGIYLKDENHWIAFDPNQIKSAETNTGEFSRLNDDIRFQVNEETGQIISDETYHQMFNARNNWVRKIGQTLRMRGTEFKQLLDKGFGAISTRLKNVDPMLAAEMRNLDFRTSQKIVAALRTAHPLLDATKKMSSEDKFVWDAARRNSDEGKIKQIAEKYNIVQAQENLRIVLNQIRQDAIDVGYDVGFIDEYWPRIIKDQEGFLQATKGISNQPVFTNALKERADKLGISVEKFQTEYPEIAADIISNTILGRNLGLGGPGNIQARQYTTVPPELNKYYMDSDAALMQYIYSMTKKIEARRFFGKVPERIGKLKAEKNRKDGQILNYEEMLKLASPEERVDINQKVDDISGDLIRIEQELDKYKLQRDYTENIGAYIDELILNKRITKDEERLVRNILDARFHEHGTTGLINAYKNMAYIDVMGSPISAITQIGDLAWAMYVGKVWTPRGLAATVKNFGKAATKSSEITKEDLGIERIAQEFADGTTLGNAVSWVFKKVGLEKMDSIGKEVLINNALDNYKAMVQTETGRTKLIKYLNPIFGTQSEGVIQDLVADNHSDNVKMLLYHRLLDFQPVALSEMPEQYLKSGNGRIFYMLKTYTLKQFDVFRNEAWHKIKTGKRDQVIEGIGNMVKLVSLLALANAGADELKDLLLGKDVKFKDHVIENFLTMGGASRYLKMQISREGLGSGLIGQILPPFKFVDAISKDVIEVRDKQVAGDTLNFDQSRIIESLPIGGKLYYWHYGRGEDYKKSSGEQSFKDVGKKVGIFKRQLENADNKREFIYANIDKFKQMKLHENFQASLSRNQAVINKLKKVPETTNVIERLGKLNEQREVLLERYFQASEGLR